MGILECQTKLDAVFAEEGSDNFWHCVKKMKARKLQVKNRPKQKSYPWHEYVLLYNRQRGICPICGHDMKLIQGELWMDHKNCNLTGEEYEARSNRQATHKKCNESKGALSIPAQAKRYSKPMTELI